MQQKKCSNEKTFSYQPVFIFIRVEKNTQRVWFTRVYSSIDFFLLLKLNNNISSQVTQFKYIVFIIQSDREIKK